MHRYLRITKILLLLTLCWPAAASAVPTPWAFDFDPNVADDPAYVNQQLQVLQGGLPGLPTEGIVEVDTDPVKLYFFDEIAEILVRARDSGPAIVPPIERPPTICVEHAGFTMPDMVATENFLCDMSEDAVVAVFEPRKVNTCFHVEFPESYVYDHSPINVVDIPMVSNWNTLISLVGEALTYVDYPEGLFPPDYLEVMRSILAKLRYQELKAQIAGQITAYQGALAKLQADAWCYDQAQVPGFTTKVNTMIAELNAVSLQLEAIYQAGLVEAAIDRATVENQGRIRVDLPFPALTDKDRELLSLYIGGICWRIRGSGLVNIPDDETGSGLYRRYLYVQFPYQLIAELAGGVADAKDVGFQIFFDESWGYAEWFDMGTSPGRDKYADLVQMTDRGKRLTTLVAPTLQGRGFDVSALVAGGLQMGPCYYYAWEELNEWTGSQLLGFLLGEDLDDKTKYPVHVMRFLEWPTAHGEFCTGGALAQGLVRTLLWGKPGGTVCTPDCTGKPCGADDGCGMPCGQGCTTPDGGVPVDGPVPVYTEAGVRVDSAVPPEAGVHQEAGPVIVEPLPDEGCSCRAGHGSQEITGGLGFLLVILLLGLRRRGAQ